MIWNALGKLALGQKATASGAAFSVSAGTGSFTLSGNSSNLLGGYRLDAQPYVEQHARHVLWSALGRVALGQSRQVVQVGTTTFSISWQTSTATVAMPAEAGTFVATGLDALFARSVAHDAGVYLLAGQAALLPVSMPAEAGSFVTTGNVIELRRPSRKIRGYPRAGGAIAARGISRGVRAVSYGG